METFFHIIGSIACAVYLMDMWLNGNMKYQPVMAVNPGEERPDAVLRELTESQAEVYRLRRVMDTLEVGIVVANENGKILMCSRPFETHLGYIRDELNGKDIHSFVPPDRREDHATWFSDFVGSDRSLEMRHVKAYGKNGVEVDTILGVNQTQPIDGKRLFVATIRAPDVHIES